MSVPHSNNRPGLRLAGLSMICLLALAGCKVSTSKGPEGGAKDAQQKGPEAVTVEVAPASKRSIAASYAGTATLEPRAESQVVAKTSGVALAVLVEEGQYVKAGQPLVRLDPDRARLNLARAEAQLRKLEANYQRASRLLEQQLISANDVDQLKYDAANARAVYNEAKLELSYTTVLAPISGVIASRNIKAGNFVQINSPIFRIVDASKLEATLNVPEREISKLKPGQAVQLSADALPGQVFTGSVDRVAPVVDSGTGTFRVVAAFTGGEPLQPGMFSRLSINYDSREDALVIPRTALLEDGGEPATFVVRGDKAARVPLKLGYSDGGFVEVREGLQDGDKVVIAGKAALREGSAVQVLGQDKAGQPAAQAQLAKAAQAGN